MSPSKNDSIDRDASNADLHPLVPWVLSALTATSVFIALCTAYAIGGWAVTIGGITIKAPLVAAPVEPTSISLHRSGLHATVSEVQLIGTPDFVYYLLRAGAILPGAAVFLYALILMRSLVATVSTGEAFTTTNVTRISRIGFTLVIGWPIAYFLGMFAQRILLNHEGGRDVVVPTLNVTTLVWPLIAGAVLLVLAVVLSVGTDMRDDVEGLV